MNKRLQSYMTQIFLVWLTLFAVLAVFTLQSMDWKSTTPVPAPSLPVEVNEPSAVSAPLPQPDPDPEPWQLLARGRAQGKGTLGKPVVAYHEDRKEVTVTIPYTGTLGQYTSFPFDGNAHGECFDLHGVWQGQPGNYHGTNPNAPVNVVQVGQHGNFMRFSLIGARGTREVRHTADEVVLVLKDATRGHGKAQERSERRPEAAPAAAGSDTAAAGAVDAGKTAGTPDTNAHDTNAHDTNAHDTSAHDTSAAGTNAAQTGAANAPQAPAARNSATGGTN